MSGHTHAQNIRRKKAVIDKKRGKLFSKLAKAIILAAKSGGGDPKKNLTLKYAIDKARQGNMPRDVIERSIKKGTGELAGGDLIEQLFEGVGPGGVHVLVECLTDNKNRIAPEMRKLFEVGGGKLGGQGSTAWMFDRKGVFAISTQVTDEDTLMELVLEAGADDLTTEGDVFEVTAPIVGFHTVKAALAEQSIPTEVAEILYLPKNRIKIKDEKTAQRFVRFLERIEENEDVQNVSSNEEIAPGLLPEAEDA